MTKLSLRTRVTLSAGILLIAAACSGGGGKAPAPAPSDNPAPPAAGSPVEPPGDPDIEMGQSGWTIQGNAAVGGTGNTAGSQFFGTVQSLAVKLSTQANPIQVSSFTIPFPNGTLTGAGTQGSAMSWTLGTTTLTACTDSCSAVTIPSAILTPSLGNGGTFTYTPTGSSSTTAPLSTLQKVKVFFQ